MGEAAPKEPSMEDILASIRRIVSQDDASAERRARPRPVDTAPPGQAPRTSPTPPPVTPSQAQPRPAAAVAPASQRATLAELAGQMTRPSPNPQTGQGSAPAAGAPREAAAQPRGQSFANLAHEMTASMRQAQAATPARAPAQAPAQPQAGAPAPSSPSARLAGGGWPSASMTSDQGAARPAPATRPEAQLTGAAARPSEQMRTDRPEPMTAAATARPVSPAPAAPAQKPASGDREVEAFRGALVSQPTESAVGDSLDRLKRGVRNDLDAKVEAILRPMLRDWLDENLPRLVERLVRAEIERIARRD